jgi:hypothetical protein
MAHGGLLSIVADRTRNRIYGAIGPTGEIVAYDVATASTTKHGRPDYQQAFVYVGRAMWTGSQGRVYFTAGNNNSGPKYGAPYDPAIFNHVHYYDPASGFGQERGWQLHDQRAIDTAQCFGSPRICYLMDNVGHLYKFAEASSGLASWTYLGGIGQNQTERFGNVWVLHVRSDQKHAYILGRKGHLLEFNLSLKTAAQIANLYQREPGLLDHDFYGFAAWDRYGRFYFAAFPRPGKPGGNARLVAIDPRQIRQ